MGRSSKEQAGANRERIVDTAGRLFRSRGYDAVGIADVMKAAGMTQGGFYKHFPSKEALAAEACTVGFDEAAAHWQSLCGSEKGGRIASVVDYYLSPKPPEYRCPMIAHGEEAARMGEGHNLRDAYVAGARSLHDVFMSKAEGSADPAYARLLFAAMVGANMLARFGEADDAQWIRDLKSAVADAARAVALTDDTGSADRPKPSARAPRKKAN